MGKSRSAQPLGGDANPLVRYPSADDIAARAHELFIAGGRRVSRITEYWRTAEAELLEEAARQLPALVRRPSH